MFEFQQMTANDICCHLLSFVGISKIILNRTQSNNSHLRIRKINAYRIFHLADLINKVHYASLGILA